MLTYDISERGNMTIYEYLYRCIKDDIIKGRLSLGEKLPSKRKMAQQHQISLKTVENAYEQLLMEGYISAREKSGYYVMEAEAGYEPRRRTSYTAMQTGSRGEEASNITIDLTSNRAAIEKFPYDTWAKVMRGILSEKENVLLDTVPFAGVYELRVEIARYLYEYRGIEAEPEQIIIGAGTEYLHGLLIQLLGNHRIYGVENPGYHKIARIYENMKVEYAKVTLDQDGVSIRELEEKCVDVIHTSPSHHFPTGIVMPVSRRYELLGWAAKSPDHYIIEDDYDSELRLTGKPFPTLQSIDVSDRVIYMNTFTKTLASTVRISYMVLPLTLTEIFYQKLSFYSCTVSNFEQYTLAKFMENGSFEKHINRMRNFYKNHRNQVIAKLKESRLWQMASIYEEDAGLHFLLHIDTQKEDSVIKDQLQQRGIRLRGMSDYTYDGSQVIPHTFIINYTAIDPQDLPEVLEEIYQVCIN